jgi:hypothetical protein
VKAEVIAVISQLGGCLELFGQMRAALPEECREKLFQATGLVAEIQGRLSAAQARSVAPQPRSSDRASGRCLSCGQTLAHRVGPAVSPNSGARTPGHASSRGVDHQSAAAGVEAHRRARRRLNRAAGKRAIAKGGGK